MKETRRAQVEKQLDHPVAGSFLGGPLHRDPAKAKLTADVIMARISVMDTSNALDSRTRSQGSPVYHIAFSLAAALVIALVSSLITLGVLRSNDTVSIRFVLSAPEAQTVTLVADFNDWSPDGHILSRNEASGDWEILVPLKKGRSYVYNFLIDGERWLPDPAAAGHIDDGLGGQASYISL